MKTSLSNKYSFNDIYNSFFNDCELQITNNRSIYCCLAIDIENFKLFNQLYGRAKGNELLYRFIQYFDSNNTIVEYKYLGQDDFIVLSTNDLQTIQQIYAELQSIVFSISKATGFLPAIGVYPLKDDEYFSIESYDRALSALKNAKIEKDNRIHTYSTLAYEAEKNEHALFMDLKEALKNEEITFYLQPQCNVSTNQIIGAEALARWIKSDGTIIPPFQYIPILEKRGFIAQFDKVIWEKVCKWLRSCLDRNITPIPISINVSQVDILSFDVIEYLNSLCTQYEIPSYLLKVEITESSYAQEFDKVQQFVQNAKKNGFLTFMDDFGSGYSSLNMLENITVDVIKLDMEFIKQTKLASHKGITIIESIINMAKMIRIPIIVEGVETEDQVTLLRNLGCQYSQGFYFYKPMPIETLEQLIMDRNNVDLNGFKPKMNEQFHVREFLDENTFTDAMLNNVLGAVAFYSLNGKDLTITRYNEQFYTTINDDGFEYRRKSIQNYVVYEDRAELYKTLNEAYINVANGSSCEVRFYKSNGSIFWFKMKFFYLKTEHTKKIFYVQIEDVTEIRQQSLQLFEVLRADADISMMINLDRHVIQYVPQGNALSQPGLPSLDIDVSLPRTASNRIPNKLDQKKFLDFFNAEHLRKVHSQAIYHETLTIPFILFKEAEMVEFNTYFIRYSKEQELNVYVFAKKVK